LVGRARCAALAWRVDRCVPMLKLVAVSCLLFAACAGVGANAVRVDGEIASHAPRLAMTARMYPVGVDPRLPSADQISRKVRAELGEVASADVRVCVAADGRVREVQLLRGTALPEFNQAVVHDLSDWQFSGIPGSTGAATPANCGVATISYRPHQ
jgi:TonB family protein